MIRFPLPYKVRGLEHPGNAEEKLRCEVAICSGLRRTAHPFLYHACGFLGSRTAIVYEAPFIAINMFLTSVYTPTPGTHRFTAELEES